jgi:hypothetical protein
MCATPLVARPARRSNARSLAERSGFLATEITRFSHRAVYSEPKERLALNERSPKRIEFSARSHPNRRSSEVDGCGFTTDCRLRSTRNTLVSSRFHVFIRPARSIGTPAVVIRCGRPVVRSIRAESRQSTGGFERDRGAAADLARSAQSVAFSSCGSCFLCGFPATRLAFRVLEWIPVCECLMPCVYSCCLLAACLLAFAPSWASNSTNLGEIKWQADGRNERASRRTDGRLNREKYQSNHKRSFHLPFARHLLRPTRERPRG